MSESIIALVDCDSFFVSCEQSLDKNLQDKPVCVVGNERGCVLARSKEAKQMGVPMGYPYFMAKKEFKDCIYVFGNYKLYHEKSTQVMNILKDFSPTVEIYSIDEAFIELSGLKKLYKTSYFGIAKLIRKRIKDEVGINVSIGVSRSKVLAKLACEKAKPGIGEGIHLIGKGKIPKILKSTKVQEIWGIGRNTALSLNRWGILNCAELTDKSDEWLKTRIGKRGVDLKHELLGECIDKIETKIKLPKSIQNTRSFPEFITDIDYIKNALNVHIHTSCKKLRKLNGKCKTISVMLRTKDFQTFWEKKNLENETDFELEISRVAIKLLEKMFDSKAIYRSCGITLEGINYETETQLGLFEKPKKKDYDKLGKAIDKLEKRFGKNIVKTGFTED